ncbi:MAG: membrane dipeptidase [Bacteroidetes bacterium]|nr:membrane dipeptidase [Bacteroidota bacterium]
MKRSPEEIQDLMRRVPVVDMHSDYAVELYRRESDGVSDALRREHAPALEAGGVSMEVLTVAGDFDIDGLRLWERRMMHGILDATRRQITADPDFHLVLDAADLRAAARREGTHFMLAFEGIRGVEDAADLRLLHAAGLRAIILTHNERNLAADGCGEPLPGGLSNFGRSILREAAELRMVLDLVHLSDPSFFDALDHWPFPPVVSHSNARALCSHRRNLTDEQIREIGRRGGVIGLNFLSLFIDDDRSRATTDRLADHAVHIASLAGPDALGLGPDYADYYMDAMQRWMRRDGLPPDTMDFVAGAEHVGLLPVFVHALSARGFSDGELTGILGGNALRVYSTILPDTPEPS